MLIVPIESNNSSADYELLFYTTILASTLGMLIHTILNYPTLLNTPDPNSYSYPSPKGPDSSYNYSIAKIYFLLKLPIYEYIKELLCDTLITNG